MNRETEYRGKRVDTGKWIYGSLIQSENHSYIALMVDDMSRLPKLTTLSWEVIPSTVGEWTGLLDKNGVKIFEGDILDKKYRWEVVFIDGAFWARSHRTVINIAELQKKRLLAGIPIEVIRSIHDTEEQA